MLKTSCFLPIFLVIAIIITSSDTPTAVQGTQRDLTKKGRKLNHHLKHNLAGGLLQARPLCVQTSLEKEKCNV